MTDNIATSANGQAMIASLREIPWHSKGVCIKEPVSGKEMLKLAHLDWDVLEAPIMTQVGTMTQKATGWDQTTDTPIMTNVLDNIRDVQIPDVKSVYRSDTGEVLGVCGEDYKVFQNSQMIDMFENLVNGHKIQYEVAGGLDKGQVVWCLAKIPDLKFDIKGDEMNQYMLIRTGHTGNMTLACFPTFIRVVCSNTISVANRQFNANRKGKKQDVHTGYAIRHTSGMDNAIRAVERAYANMLEDFTLTKEMFEAMVATPVTSSMKNSFFDFIVDPNKDETVAAKELSKRGDTMRANKIQVLEKLYESPTNQTPASKDTLFGLYNVAVEYVDFFRGTRCTEGTEESDCKFESAQFGSGKALKDKAFIKAAELIGT